MAKVIVSGNLNTYGNNGQFETDSSTWGYGASGTARSSEQASAGLYSSKFTASVNWGIILPGSKLAFANFSPEHGKKYWFKAKVRSKGSQPPATGTCTFRMWVNGQTKTSEVFKTVTSTLDSWQEIEATITYDSGAIGFGGWYAYLIGDVLGGENTIIGGQCYIDQFEIYEYTDEDTPPPVCDLDIDEYATTVINETSEGANNGSIEVEEAGTGTYEYSKNDGGAYQGSNLFTGLTTDIFIIKVRDTGVSGCEDRWPFAVNHAAVTHDFTTVLTNESISGANDAAISFNVSGTGGPFEFSINAGVSWQAGNNFTGLAPGTYFVAVRNDDGNSVVKVVILLAGTVEIDKVYHSKNPITFLKSASPGWQPLANYRLYNDVRVEDVADSGTYNSKLKVELPPDNNSQAMFYIREAFRDVFTLTPPSLSQNTIVRLTDRIKRFKNFSGEMSGAATVPVTLTESLPSMVLYGGIDKFHFPDLNYFTSYLQTNKKFLTWAPVEKYVDRLQEDYLNFYIYGNFTTIKLRIKAYFDDGTNETAITKTKNPTAFSHLYQVPAGPVNSGATLVNAEKNIVQYELTLLDQSDIVISETRTYFISKLTHPLTRFIMFLNSLGAFEVMRFTGQAVTKSSIRKEILQKFLPHNYAAITGEFEVNNAVLSRKSNLSTGHITGRMADQWHEYMQDLLLSSRIYDVTDGRRIPIMVMDADHEDEDQNYVRFQRFDVQQAYDNESFTPASI